MKSELAFDSINELIVRNSPVEETLQAIAAQMFEHEDVALARIWLIDKGDICDSCVMRPMCPDQERCLHLTASAGRDLEGKTAWTNISGRFQRFPIGVRKVGRVAASGESILLDDLSVKESSWIVDQNWVVAEKIDGFAAHPQRFKDDILGVVAVFSRKKISQESLDWLRVFS